MLIQKLTRRASTDFLARLRVGRLACAHGAQSYVVPFYFAYDNNCIYGFSSTGKKIDWMRSNPLVCVQADEVAGVGNWTSVVAYGRYEELPDTDEMQSARALAFSLLQQRVQWWEPGTVKPTVDAASSAVISVFYRIHLLEISGRRATVESNACSGAGNVKTGPVKKN